jgi:2-polyprenyl-3-methyl-5-hydroxy-6-metoxy-1,4-benzoquinol methylase
VDDDRLLVAILAGASARGSTRTDRRVEMPTVRPPLDIAEQFNHSHATHMHSPTLRRIWEHAYGEEYPAEANPNGFATRTTLRQLVAALAVGPGQTLVDLGCGHGSPGLWVAHQTGAGLLGIDLSPTGIELARSQAARLGLADRAHFQVGDLTATGLPDASVDAAMSLDVLTFVADQPTWAHEVARILRQNGRFVFTTRDHASTSAGVGGDRPADSRSTVEGAGLDVETVEEPADWQRQQRAVFAGMVAAEQELRDEMGAAEAARWVAYGRRALDFLPRTRYVFVVARRP